ncbi:Glycosyltransferase, catalytic subunit of cellulose synthase and poly-beta-1,6-N-acetylglucosamine synthase [Bradyrhizobium lablabi]|nr:Glycosyltransferase, catalytic subunit of cellulose synthase and poly-beta-1,6-N-acetylglucosamine synthase [Bradyrhizobium lablabi]
MLTFASAVLVVVTGFVSIPVAVFFVEVLASLYPVSEPVADASRLNEVKRITVIVPAHNESAGIVPTIEDIKSQLGSRDRLIVVADNCSDDTGSVAAAVGAQVITRNDVTQIGKGYALGFAINHVSLDPPDLVVFFDADCRIQSGLIGRLKHVCTKLERPVQACYLMRSPEDSAINHALSEFAWLVKNWSRPLGLWRLNCPVQLMGTGMMFPWDVIRSAPLASGDLVEDMKLGLDLAVVGKAPYFVPFVVVSSEFPMSDRGADSQRQRWIQGHIGTILKRVPQLFFRAITRGNLDLLVLTLDAAVPPLSLLGLLVVATLFVNFVAWLFGASSAPVVIAMANLAAFALAVLLAWLKVGRAVLPVRVLTSIGPLLMKRIRFYGQMSLGRTVSSWVRTDRNKN